MLRLLLLRPKIWLVLGAVSIVAIANSIFTLEHDWHLLSGLTIMIGGTLLYVNAKRSLTGVTVPPAKVDRHFVERKLQQTQSRIAKISDPALRQQISLKLQAIAQNLQQNYFQVVLLGNGSAGKTSVINAMLGRKAGQTNARIGTTTERQAYPQEINTSKTKRQVVLVDTSGMQEMGATGTQRQQVAIAEAQQSDLLIFVTAGDLTSSEYTELERLASLGKRLILAFNKTDLYLPSDRQLVLDNLQKRTQHFLNAKDIVAISAKPNPIKVRQYLHIESSHPQQSSPQTALQEWWEELPPDITALKERIEAILSYEWEELLIQNSHLQIQTIDQDIDQAINQQRRQDAQIIINRYQLLNATTVFANPIPAIDLLAGTAISTQMLIDLGKIYEQPLRWQQAQKYGLIMAQQLLQLGCVEIVTSAISACFKTNAITYAIGGSMQALTAAYITHIGGMSFVEYLEQQSLAHLSSQESAPELTTAPQNELLDLQTICQNTFNQWQSDRFINELVMNMSKRLWAHNA
ncbi:MAG: GTP-binding protein [Pseudanabaenaceae cyanobacterium bins.39]|nr:GTP-binding protein [Pseudanabaenaceae cyanobacterium bins.39]